MEKKKAALLKGAERGFGDPANGVEKDQQESVEGWRCSLVVECLPSMLTALGSNLSTSGWYMLIILALWRWKQED